MKTIAFLPLRGGSKSIPLKNIKKICGQPLAYWTLKAAQECPAVDIIIVATDSIDIKNTVLSFAFNKIHIYDRSLENSQDISSTESVILEFLKKPTMALDPEDLFILLQATNPFTTSSNLSQAVAKVHQKYPEKISILSVTESKRFFWNHQRLPINYDFQKRPRRQDFSGCYLENGAFYISRVQSIMSSGCRISTPIDYQIMPEYTAYEIDEPEDWIVVENLLQRQMDKLHKLKKNNAPLKLFLSDVDGVLTDAGMYYSENGDELKKFNTYDGMGFKILQQYGIKTGFVTSENRQLNQRRAEKLKMDYLFQGMKEKLVVVEDLCRQLQLTLDNVAYIGDDINCYNLLEKVGYKACPDNAVDKIKSIPGIYHLKKSGGNGAVREWIDYLFREGIIDNANGALI